MLRPAPAFLIDELLVKRNLLDLRTSDRKEDTALIRHSLDLWSEPANSLPLLNYKSTTCTLSNGHQTLLRYLVAHGKLSYSKPFSGEYFCAYKPSVLNCEGAAGDLDLKRAERRFLQHTGGIGSGEKV